MKIRLKRGRWYLNHDTYSELEDDSWQQLAFRQRLALGQLCNKPIKKKTYKDELTVLFFAVFMCFMLFLFNLLIVNCK